MVTSNNQTLARMAIQYPRIISRVNRKRTRHADHRSFTDDHRRRSLSAQKVQVLLSASEPQAEDPAGPDSTERLDYLVTVALRVGRRSIRSYARNRAPSRHHNIGPRLHPQRRPPAIPSGRRRRTSAKLPPQGSGSRRICAAGHQAVMTPRIMTNRSIPYLKVNIFSRNTEIMDEKDMMTATAISDGWNGMGPRFIHRHSASGSVADKGTAPADDRPMSSGMLTPASTGSLYEITSITTVPAAPISPAL